MVSKSLKSSMSKEVLEGPKSMSSGGFRLSAEEEAVKENPGAGTVPAWTVLLLAAMGGAALLVAAYVDDTLPAPRAPGGPATLFVAQHAAAALHNLTAIGPRVAGSYENEVLGAAAVAAAVRWAAAAAAAASPHNTVQLQVHTASGAFPLSFFDGMTNVYRDVQSVVARVSGVGARGRRPALLLNCHFDTVPGSPGASDDAAGCAVLVEVLRALAAARRPLRRDAVFLFNGAEENIMQASHAFVTTHEWAKSVRAFINLEACGAGGREVLFQAGPHDPWIMEVYASVVPRPFASSMAQELFESGVIPGDTDFRVFRDFGNLSGVDLAWSANGYVYHTHLDTAARVPLGALQRTGDNVLALAHGLLESPRLDSAVELARQPVFFDVLGVFVVCARPALAAAAVAAALALTVLAIRDGARDAHHTLCVPHAEYVRGVLRAGVVMLSSCVAGILVAITIALVLHSLGLRLMFYSRPWLLLPLYILPSLITSWLVCIRLSGYVSLGGAVVRGGLRAQLAAGAVTAGWALLLALCAAKGLRSGFVPLQWTAMLALADRLARITRVKERGRCAWWCACALFPLVSGGALCRSVVSMFVPLTARCGTGPLPPDAALTALTAALAAAQGAALLPLVLAAPRLRRALLTAAALVALTTLVVSCTSLGFPYSPISPQRIMLFHTRRTVHTPSGQHHEDLYWVPHLDPNIERTLKLLGEPTRDSVEECEAWPYCGAPYYLPVLGLVAYGYRLPAATPPALTTTVTATTEKINATLQALHINVTGPSHTVVIVAPLVDAEVVWCSVLGGRPQAGARWRGRRSYFFSLHSARAPRPWRLELRLQHALAAAPAAWAALSVAGHHMAAPPSPALAALMARLPPWTAPVGWPVHLHLLHV